MPTPAPETIDAAHQSRKLIDANGFAGLFEHRGRNCPGGYGLNGHSRNFTCWACGARTRGVSSDGGPLKQLDDLPLAHPNEFVPVSRLAAIEYDRAEHGVLEAVRDGARPAHGPRLEQSSNLTITP